jgi:hypothetical protein
VTKHTPIPKSPLAGCLPALIAAGALAGGWLLMPSLLGGGLLLLGAVMVIVTGAKAVR